MALPSALGGQTGTDYAGNFPGGVQGAGQFKRTRHPVRGPQITDCSQASNDLRLRLLVRVISGKMHAGCEDLIGMGGISELRPRV